MIDVPEVWGTFLSRPTNRIGKQARLLIGEVVRPKVVIPIAVWVTVVGPSSVRPKEQKGEKDYRENSQHFALAMFPHRSQHNGIFPMKVSMVMRGGRSSRFQGMSVMRPHPEQVTRRCV